MKRSGERVSRGLVGLVGVEGVGASEINVLNLRLLEGFVGVASGVGGRC